MHRYVAEPLILGGTHYAALILMPVLTTHVTDLLQFSTLALPKALYNTIALCFTL